jgi:deoxyribodipyrimidine photo-lyase
MTGSAIFWFRRDLRLEDNAGLYHALRENESVIPLFIFDSEILSELEDKHDRRVDFVHQAVLTLNAALAGHGSALVVRHGNPCHVFSELTREISISTVYCNHDYEPYAIRRDNEIAGILKAKGIGFKTFKDQVIFEKSEIVKQDGSPYLIYTPYATAWLKKLNDNLPLSFRDLAYKNFFKSRPLPVPALEELGFQPTGISINISQVNENVIRNYSIQRDFPAAGATTKLSVHLRFGTISIRHVVSAACANEKLLKELVWREFFMCILWHFPYVVVRPFRKEFEGAHYLNNEEHFRAWCEGRTGYPFVDAGMRELAATGYMHNRTRMVAASFLARNLLIDWRWGEAWFAKMLLDFELSSNNGNWQWAAGCGCDAAPYFRIFNPESQQRRFDPDLVYVRKWVPELDTPQYPAPIVEHSFARERALRWFRAIFHRR